MNSLYCSSAKHFVKNKMKNMHGFRILIFLSFYPCWWALSSFQKAGPSADCHKVLISFTDMRFLVLRLNHFILFSFSQGWACQYSARKEFFLLKVFLSLMSGEGLADLLQVNVPKIRSFSRGRINRCVTQRFKIILHVSNSCEQIRC